MAPRAKHRHAPVRRRRDDDLRHWLNEGRDGQQSLFMELDPLLLAADEKLCHIINAVAHRSSHGGMNPIALYAPPDDCVGLLIDTLAAKFSLWILTSGEDEIQFRAVDSFGAHIITSDIPQALLEQVDFALFTDPGWADEIDFFENAGEICSYLSSEGEACFVLQGVQDGETLLVEWSGGVVTPLEEFLSKSHFRVSPPSEYTVIPVKAPNIFGGSELGEFLKRHRRFFGMNSHELLLERLRDPDFVACYEHPVARSAIVVTW